MNLRRIAISLFLLLSWVASPLAARVVRVEITSRTDIAAGKSFGTAGPYERITGKVYFSVAVANPHNRRIVDLANAVNLKNGQVEFSSDFVAVRPKHLSKGNGSMLLEIPNRGRAFIIALVDGGGMNVVSNPGDGWLLRRGFTIVSLGWQWDAPQGLRLYAPIAKDHGKTITGLLRGDFTPWHVRDEIPLGHLIVGRIGGTEYPVAAPDDPRNTLTVRDSREAPRTVIPRSKWQFAHMVNGKLEPSNRFIHLDGGFQPGKLYEYVYVVKDPVVAGLGFAAVRDFASYVKHAHGAELAALRVYGEGISQNGRYLRDFLYQGFNADEEGRMALDGVLAHVAGAGRGSFNYRFAQPSRDAEPMSSVFFPIDIFPFTGLPETDPVTGRHGGLLDRATAEHVLPKIFFSNTSYEYWGRAAALIHITPDGQRDARISPNVRIYKFTGLQHFSGPFPPARGKGDLLGQEPQSPLPVRYFWRAMISNMDAWVRRNIPPPPSRYPKIADGTLVPLSKYSFPHIPGVNLPHEADPGMRLDFGPHWRRDGILSLQPPKVGPDFPVLVPQPNGDGNERDGVCLHPRLSIAERYKSRADYLARFTRATDELVKERWILKEDRAALIHRGEQEWDRATRP
ncbi:MAG: alpha/beta hydrolase domain-containing protein [Acidobacteriota bacterium]